MRVSLLVLSIVLTTYALAGETLTLKGQETTYVFFQKSGLRVSESCLKGPCDALKVPSAQRDTPTSKSFTGHPAAKFCELQGATYIIAKRESGDEDGLCQFKDKSYILSWDYFRKFQSGHRK